jgi:hypothetical protein
VLGEVPSGVFMSAPTVKSQLPVARWQSSTARVSNWVPSSRGTSVVAVLLAAYETGDPTNGIDTSTRPTPAIAVASRIIGAPCEPNLSRTYAAATRRR